MLHEPTLKETLSWCSGDEYCETLQTLSHIYKVDPRSRVEPATHDSHKNPAKPTTCGYFGLPSHQPRQLCPAKGKTFAFCGKLNHYTSVCCQKNKPAKEFRRIFVNRIPDEPRIKRITPGQGTRKLLSTCDKRTVVCRTPTITVKNLNSRKPGHITAAEILGILGTDLFDEMGMKIDELTESGGDTLSVADHLQDDGDRLPRRRRSWLALSWLASLRLQA